MREVPTREAALLFPKRDNDGADLSKVHAALRADLLTAFGGYTVSEVSGQWRDSDTGAIYDDESLRYAVAAQWTPELTARLDSIARHYCAAAGQVTLYVMHAGGSVVFVTPEAAPVAVAA
jgi:hypothetical protein